MVVHERIQAAWEEITADCYYLLNCIAFCKVKKGLHRKWLDRFLSKRESQWVRCSYMGKLAGYCKFIMLNPCLHTQRGDILWLSTTARLDLKAGGWLDPDSSRACGLAVRFVTRPSAPGQECKETCEVNCFCGKSVLTQLHTPQLRGKEKPWQTN